MFRIKEDINGGLETITIQNAATMEYVSIVPDFGGNVNELVLRKNGRLHPIIDGNQNISDFGGKAVFKGAKLVPFPNRLEDGTYTFEGKKYRLDLNYPEEHNACHGFIYDKGFTLIDFTEDRDCGTVKLFHKYTGFLPGYPFEFKTELNYSLTPDRGFGCLTRIENTGTNSMPVGDGWHPFFTFKKTVDDLELRLAAEQKIEVDERSIPTGASSDWRLFDNFNRIGNIGLDACFKLKPGKDGIQTTELRDGERDLKIQLWQETGDHKYNYLQLYLPPERLSIAMEPMTCNINAFNNTEGLIVLNPGDIFSAKYGVKLA